MLSTVPQRTSSHGLFSPQDIFSDSREHGHQGPTRNVRIHRVASNGGGAIATSEDGSHCVVAGKESLRILRCLQPSQPSSGHPQAHKTSVGKGGYRIEASRNMWDGSGLKIDSASTDVAWGHGNFSNKILTSARNGELIMWDINKASLNKYERRSKLHIRSINKLSMSHVEHYCITGSADGDIRVWDLRDMTKSLMRIHHPTSVRSVVFSPNQWKPLQAVVGLDNGSIYRWDLQMRQKGQLDRLSFAHSGPVMALDWCSSPARPMHSNGVTPDSTSAGNSSLGCLASGGLDRCVKIWNLTAPNLHSHIPHKPTYLLHPSFPVRRVVWRPSYECELAIVSNEAFGTGSNHDLSHVTTGSGISHSRGTGWAQPQGLDVTSTEGGGKNVRGDPAEIWDVRRSWIAKWSVTGSAVEGGVTDLVFGDSHTVWTQHSSGTFSQIDLRDATKPIDAVPRVAITWEAAGSLAFVSDKKTEWEIPYDDINVTTRQLPNLQKVKMKTIRDGAATLNSQNMGTYATMHSATDLDIFSKLAKSYVFEGNDRISLCHTNANAAFQAGRDEAGHAWLFLASLITDNIPDSPKIERELPINENTTTTRQPVFPFFTDTSLYSFLARKDPPNLPSISSEFSLTNSYLRGSPKTSSLPITPEVSSNKISWRVTPSTSATSTSTVPATTHSNLTLLSKREPDAGLTGLPRRQSVHHQPSTSAISNKPSDKRGSSLRHVGEGALADSDSSEAEESVEKGDVSSGEGRDGAHWFSGSKSPQLGSIAAPLATSALLSGRRENGKDHRERNEKLSPSPKLTDTESSGVEPSLPQRLMSLPRKASRNSTVAFLAAASFQRPLANPKQELHSNIQTVSAAEPSSRNEDQKQDVGSNTTPSYRRHMSRAKRSNLLSPDTRRNSKGAHATLSVGRRSEIISADKKRSRETAWEVFRGQLETFADKGDAQMCAMLSLVASKELRLSPKRVTRFLEAYIEILTRLRLYTSVAHLRKYSDSESLRTMTRLETTTYTLCARCRKPFSHPAETPKLRDQPKDRYSYCRTCRSYSTNCSICRLPVRTMLFHCPICRHGGHRECYARYYMARPMVDVPSSVVSTRSRPSSSEDVGGSNDENVTVSDSVVDGDSRVHHQHQHHRTSRILGHPCAAGCGHICWAANFLPDYVP